MRPTLEELATLLESPSPAVLTTYRKDRSALTTPVWFRLHERQFEIVVAVDDVKLQHLRRDRQCVLVIFEAVAPFRGLEVRGEAELSDGAEVGAVRRSIARLYLGAEAGDRFAAARVATPGVVVRIASANVRTWDLTAILSSTPA